MGGWGGGVGGRWWGGWEGGGCSQKLFCSEFFNSTETPPVTKLGYVAETEGRCEGRGVKE